MQKMARALSGNLTQRQDECPLDALTAMALGSLTPGRESHLNSLGVSLIAFKHARQPAFHARAMGSLASALKWYKVRRRDEIAKQAILEWVVDACEACTGTREVFDTNGVSRPCMSCSASGKRRYFDEDRKGLPGKSMGDAHAVISLAVSIAVRGALRRLV